MSIRLLFHFNLFNCQADKPKRIDSAIKKAIKGIVRVTKEYYPDHTDKKGIFGMVDVTYVKDLNNVYLSEIKADPFFKDFPLVKQARLSVMPVTLKQWKKLIKMSEKNERI